MMPTAEELRVLKDEEQKIFKSTGVQVGLIRNKQPWAQWWKEDGTPLPNKLPADAYHVTKYLNRGWSMTAPVEPVMLHPNGANGSHVHRYNRKMGSVCKQNGCDAARTTEYKKRQKKAVQP